MKTLLIPLAFFLSLLHADMAGMERLRQEERALTLAQFKELYKERLPNRHQMLRKYRHLRTGSFTDETLPPRYAAAVPDANRTLASLATPFFLSSDPAYLEEKRLHPGLTQSDAGGALTSGDGDMDTGEYPGGTEETGTDADDGGGDGAVLAPSEETGDDPRIRTGVASPWARKR